MVSKTVKTAKTAKPAPSDDAGVIDTICRLLGEGVPLRQILRDEDGMPGPTAFYSRLDVKSGLYNFETAERIAQARARGYDAIAADCLEIADDAKNDYMERRKGEEVQTVFDAEHVQRSKLRIETRLKLLAKWDPARYGEKLAIGGADDLPPIKTMSDEQLTARIAALTARQRVEKA